MSLKTTGQHLVSLIEDKELQVLGLKEASLHHVVDTAGGTDDDMGATALELLNIILNDGTTNAGLDLDVHVLTDGVNDVSNLHGKLTGWGHNKSLAMVRHAAFWVSVNALEHTNGEGTSLTSTRLSLSDGILTLDKREDTFGLNGRGVLETVSIDTSKDALLQAHVIKLINFQIPIRFENFFDYLTFLILIFTVKTKVFSFL